MKEERSYPHSELTRKIIGIEVGLLINFGKKVEVKRKIFTNTK